MHPLFSLIRLLSFRLFDAKRYACYKQRYVQIGHQVSTPTTATGHMTSNDEQKPLVVVENERQTMIVASIRINSIVFFFVVQ